MRIKALSLLTVGGLALAVAPVARAQLRTLDDYHPTLLPPSDDGSSGLVSIGFTLDFYGSDFSGLYVNTNGNVTFSSALATSTPFDFYTSPTAIIAPFFADVYLEAGHGSIEYGAGRLGGYDAFAVTWTDVGAYYQIWADNTFQLVIVDRSDRGVGDFDFEFNYGTINWEAGTSSGADSNGIGGSPAVVGFSSGAPGHVAYEFTGSGVSGDMLDSNADTGLVWDQWGTPVVGDAMAGRYVFQVRNGVVSNVPGQPAVPEPATYGGVAVTLLGALGLRRLRRRERESCG